jgi:predicted dehydrogenase
MTSQSAKRRVALVGTGDRGVRNWGRNVLANHGEWVELVALSDTNSDRLAVAREAIGVDAPTFTNTAAMLAEIGPDTVIVCSRDDTHADIIVAALESGSDVITEKPMATAAEGCRRILDAERRTGHRVDVAFNYRSAPTARKIKELLLAGEIGAVTSVDFHWYLDVRHGADYFRRWHAFMAHGGSLFVHKATHHFDLLNWYLAADPQEVFARGALVHYGRAGPYRGVRCRTCEHTGECDYFLDLGADPWLEALYEEPSRADSYFRDACVFRETIDIFDTMTAAILYENGVQVSYSLNAFMPIEGYHLAFNGQKGRIEIRQYERQPFPVPAFDEILLIRNFGAVDRIAVEPEPGGHFGGDPALQELLFVPGTPDPLGRRAGARAGAMSVLCGVAAAQSARTGQSEAVKTLLGPQAAATPAR